MRLPLSLPLQPSRCLAGVLISVHWVAGGATLLTALPWAVRIALLGMVVWSWWGMARQPWRSVCKLHLGARGDLEIETKVGARGTALIEPSTALFPWLIVLVLRQEERRMVLPICMDAVGGDGYRQLRLWLGWRARIGPASGV